MSTGKFLLGVILGAAAGAAAGMLLAPEKGADTRERLSDMSEEYLDTVRDKFDDLLDNISAKVGKIKKDMA